jgi:hypothetical protein
MMSRELPARPNLEFLKKEAKDLLPGLQLRDPSAQLSDAQYQLARDYGFDSWPKMKAHVESLEVESVFAGRWILNRARSVQHPLNGDVRSARVAITVAGDQLTVHDEVVRDHGAPDRHHNVLQADGVERAIGDRPGYSILSRFRDPRTVEFVVRNEGTVLDQGTYEVSRDGQTLTIRGNQQVAVFDRST